MAAVSAQTHAWLMHACTSDYPSEDLTNNDGWPSKMMGPMRAEKLQKKGINNFKQLMKQATSMDEAQFKAEFGGRDGALDNAAAAYWEVLNTWYQAQMQKKGQKVAQTDDWLMWADSHPVPAESLELRQGWAPGMLGEIRVSKLKDQGYTKTSQLLDAAARMSHDQFVEHFGGAGGALDNRASAFYSFLTRIGGPIGRRPDDNGPPPPPPVPVNNNFTLIAVVLLVMAIAYKFMA